LLVNFTDRIRENQDISRGFKGIKSPDFQL